ncbi:hypothetical protein GCM10011338_40920 [Alteromonas lipolytica]|nr:hypothetical protein GCM10011338_40920 [Alteromonas lipolytica]
MNNGEPASGSPAAAGENAAQQQDESADSEQNDATQPSGSAADDSPASGDNDSAAPASTPAKAAAKAAKPATEARKGQQQQQQNQSGNQSNRNSQNSGNQAGDDGKKQSRGIGGLMLSVPMADQFIGTQGPGPQQQKTQQTTPEKQISEQPEAQARGHASGNTGQHSLSQEEAWEKRLLQGFYKRGDNPQTNQNKKTRGQD